MTVPRTGPTSAISSANRTKASAVQTRPRMAIDASAAGLGTVTGHWAIATGRYRSADSVSAGAMTPRDGTPASLWARIHGPSA